MKKEIKTKFEIGDKTFEFNIQNIYNKNISDVLNEWRMLIEQHKNGEDVWTVIPALPQYKFKNLKVESGPFDNTTDGITEMTITINYDEVKNLTEKE